MTVDDLRAFNLVYLASPYSKYADGIDAAFYAVAHLAGRLVKSGVNVFCPIAHAHPIAIHGNIDPLDHRIWLPLNQPILDACDALVIATLPGWDKSFGVAHERREFEGRRPPVYTLDPETLAVARLTPVPVV